MTHPTRVRLRQHAMLIACCLATVAQPAHARPAAAATTIVTDAVTVPADTVHAATNNAHAVTDTVHAAADTIRVPQLVVTATRLPMPLHAVPAATTVITGDELRASGVRLIADALRAAPGVSVARSGSHGGITALFLRGGQSDYVQVLIDGVKLNAPGGEYDFAHLPVDNIDRIEIVRGPASVLHGSDAVAGVVRIEIVRGPASVLHGSDAVAGVVQIFTRTGGGPAAVTASIEAGRSNQHSPPTGTAPGGGPGGGSSNAVAFDVAVAGALGGVRYGVGGSRLHTDGVLPVNNEYENRSLSGRLHWSAPARPRAGWPTARTDVALTARWLDNRYHFPTDGAGRIVDENQFTTGTATLLGAELSHFVTPLLQARLALATHRFDSGFHDRPDSPADTLGVYAAESVSRTERHQIDARADAYIAAGTILSVGAAHEWQRGTSRYASSSEWGPFEAASDDARRSAAAYLQLLSAPRSAVTVTAGARLEDNEMFGRFTTWRAGANLRVGAGTTLRAAAGTAFKEPSFFENFAAGGVVGNPDLAPEQSRSWDVGIVQQLGPATATLTYFDQRFHDMIQFDPRPRADRPADANYYNLAAATAGGVELELQAQPFERLYVRGAWTQLRTEVRDAGAAAGHVFTPGAPLLRRPAHAGSVTAHGTTGGRLRGSATWQYVGARDDVDYAADWQGERITLPAYGTVALAAELDVLQAARAGTVAVRIRVDNVFDARYQEIRNFRAPGRTVFVGLRAGG